MSQRNAESAAAAEISNTETTRDRRDRLAAVAAYGGRGATDERRTEQRSRANDGEQTAGYERRKTVRQ